jgi:hypothetical protein
MPPRAAAARERDAFAAVGDAIAAAAEAMRKSTSDARAAASHAVPAVRTTLAKGVYVATYYISYGVVAAALSIGRLVPPDSALAYGIRDGAAAARSVSRDGARRVGSAARKRVAVRRLRGRRARRTVTP